MFPSSPTVNKPNLIKGPAQSAASISAGTGAARLGTILSCHKNPMEPRCLTKQETSGDGERCPALLEPAQSTTLCNSYCKKDANAIIFLGYSLPELGRGMWALGAWRMHFYLSQLRSVGSLGNQIRINHLLFLLFLIQRENVPCA